MPAPMNRRTFLRSQALLLAGAGLKLSAPSLFAAAVPDVAVVTGDIPAAVGGAVELLGGMSSVVRTGDRVVIKPNMSFAQPPEAAVTTHPLVIQTLARLCREAGASRVDILDHPLSSVETCLERTGIKAACAVVPETKVEGRIDAENFVETVIPGASAMSRTDVMREVLEADVLIAAPVAKHHGSAGVSLSMKGMMGLIYNRSVMHWRYDLHTSIVDLATLLRADLAVIDASRVLTTNGPGGPGKVITSKTIIASRDMVAADAQTVALFPWYDQRISPSKVKHIRIAHERGFGRMDIENLNVARIDL